MKFSDVKLLLPSSGYMKTSVVDGRTVIDEIRDASYERNHQSFVGDDRPELHKGLGGFHQVCVEKESTNLIEWSVDLDKLPVGTAELVNDEFFGTASIINNTQVGSAEHLVPVSEIATRWFIVKPMSEDIIRINHRFNADFNINRLINYDPVTNQTTDISTSGVTIINHGVINLDGGYKLVFVSAVNDEDSPVWRAMSIVTTGVHRIAQMQMELGSYPTLPIITQGTPVTRLAPSPVIENALPETGTVAGVVDGVRNSTDSFILFDSGGITSQQRTVLFNTGGSSWSMRIYGTGGGSISDSNLLSMTNNERNIFSFLASWSETNVSLYFLGNSGNIYSATSTHELNDMSRQDVSIGYDLLSNNPHTSCRFEKPWYKDEIVRVNATDDEIKAFFETLTKGTSMEMKAEDMVIV